MADRVILTIGTKKGVFVAEGAKARGNFALRGPFGPGVPVYSTLIDTRGTPHTEKLKFTERFTRPDMNTLQYQATIDDPGAYTKPWTTQVFTMRWAANVDPFEYVCQDNNHGPELMLGSQSEIDNTKFFVP